MLRDARQTPSSLNIIRTTIVIAMSHIYRVCAGALYWVLSRGPFRGEIKAVAERPGLCMCSPRTEMLG